MSETQRLRGVPRPPLLLLLLSGCAFGRSVVSVTPLSAVNPNSGAYARIESVEDVRHFEASPRDPSTPSLKNVSEIGDPAITGRAVARKRSGFGVAWGDVVLPPGETVVDLVRAAARKALNDRGYVVLEPGSPKYTAAEPLEIQVAEFWTWFTPGAATVRIEFKGTANLRGAGLLERNPAVANSYLTTTGFAMTDSDYAEIVRRGVEDLSVRIENHIRSASSR